MIRSLDDDTNFFEIVAGVLEKDMLKRYLFIRYQDYVLRTSIDLIKEYSFNLKRLKADNILQKQWNDQELLANIQAWA